MNWPDLVLGIAIVVVLGGFTSGLVGAALFSIPDHLRTSRIQVAHDKLLKEHNALLEQVGRERAVIVEQERIRRALDPEGLQREATGP